jgi:GTP pyrophosphokinase
LIIDLFSLLGSENDRFGQSMAEHSFNVLRHLRLLHLGDACEAAAVLASTENNAKVLAAVTLQEAQVDSEALALFKLIYRVRLIAQKTQDSANRLATDNSLEASRKLLISLSSDLRVVIVLLSSRLETLRFHVRQKLPAPAAFASETLGVYGPLANRLGMWSLKWELEDLAFRFAQPEDYKRIAGLLAVKRLERETTIDQAVAQLRAALASAGITAQVYGRPKHIYSIFNKMRTKALSLQQIQDLLALRVVAPDEQQCYRALGVIHALWPFKQGEFDDYIARPKSNGYKSLHTVIEFAANRPLEVQIRTDAMHEFAEYGAAAHWRYKESSTGTGELQLYDAAAQKLGWIRQLLAWQQELGKTFAPNFATGDNNQPILVLTPEAKIIELPPRATPIDFAYHVHTNLGHRCRGARVDGALVPLSRALESGQVVEIIVAKRNDTTGPSRDWLNPELGFVISHRARSKVRAWFNEQRAVISLPDAAMPAPKITLQDSDPAPLNALRRPAAVSKSGQILVVGVDLLLTQLARCCRPIPPDLIRGYVTRGKGISIHRDSCANLRSLMARNADRVLETAWDSRVLEQKTDGKSIKDATHRFNADIQIEAIERPTLLRDMTEVLSKEKVHISSLSSQGLRGVARIRSTLSVENAQQLARTLRALAGIKGVLSAERRH